MKNFSTFLVFFLASICLLVTHASALTYHNNITIYDGNGYIGSGVGGEDAETEPGMINNQDWDLEGFFLNGTALAMVGGFNFQNGYQYDGALYEAGDIFIDVCSTGSYDYVLDMDYADGKYNVYDISSGYDFKSCSVAQNIPYSDPFQYRDGGTVIRVDDSILYEPGLSDSDVGGMQGGYHNAVSVDLAFLGQDINNFTVHSTLSCGNDNLMGSTAPVPEPATMFIFGTGLIGMVTFGRKKFGT